MKDYEVEVNIKWVQVVEAKNKEEAFEKTVEVFEDEFNFRPHRKEMKIIKGK